jgi:hypothetical protein
MLFHIKQTHAPHDCPYGKGGSRSLFDGESKDVKIHGYWLAFPQHTTYLVVETDDITHLQKFLSPGSAVTTCEITPVSDQPARSRARRGAGEAARRGASLRDVHKGNEPFSGPVACRVPDQGKARRLPLPCLSLGPRNFSAATGRCRSRA